ncbi:integrase catalytic domain-containing protein [Caldisericum sp. AR60]|uniref:integrase catalytic domain-containing protein n=1 Tax=Caldisericum sp. AR60 TaxID=3397852 RepID=UPI0039FCCB73
MKKLEEILKKLKEGGFMSLSLKEKKAVIREESRLYKKTTKKEKEKILDEFVKLTGYSRCYASYVLRTYGKKVIVELENGKRNVFVGDDLYSERGLKIRKRKRERIYGEEVFNALVYLWKMSDYLCGKRLSVYVKEIIPVLERFNEFPFNEEVKEKLISISPATIDRLLKNEKNKFKLKGKTLTKPGTLLKHSIPIRTFSEWNEEEPGFVEADLVGHDGGNLRGEFLYSLDVTDVHTGWTETRAIKNKAQVWTFNALKEIRREFPFPIKGIDSDNGSEFINAHLLNYCEKEHITFTRARPYRKNDNCFVEQKNYSVVRRAVGYVRYDTDGELKIMDKLYSVLRLYTNFFLPSMKLREKTRIGSKVMKKYDKPKTPYERILESEKVSEEVKEKLRRTYETLNPLLLKRQIDKITQELSRAYDKKMKERAKKTQKTDVKLPNDFPLSQNNFVYNLNEATK